MCFTKEMSLGFFLTGIIGAYCIKNKNLSLYLPIIYFSLMELLQYIGYVTIENRSKFLNKMIAILIYIHIGFQPYFINLWFSNFISSSKLIHIDLILKLCLVFGLFWISRLFFWDKSYKNLCDSNNEPGCGKFTEVLKGLKHLLYKAKIRASNYITPTIFMHFFLFFIPVLFLGIKKIVYIIIFLSGLLGWLLASNIHEAASIWCVVFIPILLISIIYKENILNT